jgi:hypothetical protein
MTSGVRTVVVKDHWVRLPDGTYISHHPKYEGMKITKIKENTWELTQRGLEPVKRDTLAEAKRLAYQEANWIAPSVREFI